VIRIPAMPLRTRIFLLAKRLLFPGIDVATRKRVNRFARYIRKGDLLTLDAGCGNGAFSFRAVKAGNRVIGIDFDQDKLRRCEEFRVVLGIPSERCVFRVHSIYEIESLGLKFDQIICFETLEHLLHDEEVLCMFARVLKPGGWLHLGTPRSDRKPYYGETISDTEDGGHVRLGYTHAQFERLLATCGLHVLQRDQAVGWLSQRVLDFTAWMNVRLLASFPQLVRTGMSVVIFAITYPMTFIENLVPTKNLCIYVLARKTDAPG